MGYTLQQLQQMGATPGVSSPNSQPQQAAPQQNLGKSKGISYEQLKSMGAQEGVTSPAPAQQSGETQPTDNKPDYLGNPSEVWGGIKSVFDPTNYARFVKSAVAMPVDIGRGLMGMGPITAGEGPNGIKTFQSEFAHDTVPAVERGDVSPGAATLGTFSDVVGSGAGFLGAGKIPGAIEKIGLGMAEKKALNTAETAVAPRLTAKVAENSTTKTSPIRGLISRVPTNTENEMRDAVKGIVKGKSFSQDKELVRGAIGKEASQLETQLKGIKQPVSKTGVKTWLDQVQKPIEIESDATQTRKFDITKNSLEKIVNKNIDENSNIDTLLKARKEFDALVDKEFPNLYDHENAPWRSAVTSFRNSLNDAIEANLPDGFGYKESLRKQSMMYRAVDNMAEKAARGSPSVQGEIGTTRLQRFTDKHPKSAGLIKRGARYAGEGAIIGGTGAAGYGLYKHFSGGE